MQVLEGAMLNQGCEIKYSSLLCASRLVNFLYLFILFYFFVFCLLFKKKEILTITKQFSKKEKFVDLLESASV